MTRTPEGYLVCHNVPIARTGWYKYREREVGKEGDNIVKVHRSEDEVFNIKAISSFEGKPVTDEHPPEGINSSNVKLYSKGVVQNVRRSKDEPDLVLADLIIYEDALIQEVLDGKREVSCGYDYTCVENEDGTYSQVDIRGNHVAVVDAGRAGKRVSIKDTGKEINRDSGGNRMSKIKKPRRGQSINKFLNALGLKQYAMDAEPEELADVVDEMVEESKDEDISEVKEKENVSEGKDEEPLNAETMVELIKKAVKEELQTLAIKSKDEEKPEEAIDNLVSELEGEDSEESGTIEADDEGLPDAEISNTEDRPVNPISAADKAMSKALLNAFKPIIATLPDPVQRKQATDSITNAVNVAKKNNRSRQTNVYAQIANAQKQKATDSARKAQVNREEYLANIGDEIAKKYNANYKGGK